LSKIVRLCRSPVPIKVGNILPTHQPTIPQYLVYINKKARRTKDKGFWLRYDFMIDAKSWHEMTDKQVWLDPGEGPIRIEVRRIRK